MHITKNFSRAIAIVGSLVAVYLLASAKNTNNGSASQDALSVRSAQLPQNETLVPIVAKINSVELEQKSVAKKNVSSISSADLQKLPEDDSDKNATEQPDSEISNPIIFENSDYSNYETNALIEMANAGNVIAMQVLAVRYLTKERSEKNFESAQKLLENAIVYGAKTYPFQFLAEQRSSKLRSSIVNPENISESEKRNALVETFTYYEVAAIRGNPELKNLMTQIYEDQYKLTPTPEEWAVVQNQASSLYKKYEQNRIAAGLGKF